MRLTAVEQRIVAAVMSGATNKEVAGRFGLAEQTVKNRLSRVYRKLGVRNRVELVAQASRARRGEHDS